jgi:hypothetical protein
VVQEPNDDADYSTYDYPFKVLGQIDLQQSLHRSAIILRRADEHYNMVRIDGYGVVDLYRDSFIRDLYPQLNGAKFVEGEPFLLDIDKANLEAEIVEVEKGKLSMYRFDAMLIIPHSTLGTKGVNLGKFLCHRLHANHSPSPWTCPNVYRRDLWKLNYDDCSWLNDVIIDSFISKKVAASKKLISLFPSAFYKEL